MLPTDWHAYERVTGAIAVRTALCSRAREQTLLFLVPEPTAHVARHLTASLLVGNHAHTYGSGELPSAEVRSLFRGDVLLVTPSIGECKAELEDIALPGYRRLRDIWDVVPLSRYSATRSEKPRVFLANPGWLSTVAAGRRYGAVIIDASHPRTVEQLPALLRQASGCSAVRFAVAPPQADAVLSQCGYPQGGTSVWVWDPLAKVMAETAIEPTRAQPDAALRDRYLWVCDSDAEASKVLADLHAQLTTALRLSAGQAYPGLQLCWGLYNRLRQLAVPLVQLEQAAGNTWSGSLRDRLHDLAEVRGHGNVAWETTWPALRQAAENAYKMFLRREDTAKFWGVAGNVQAFLSTSRPLLRVVVASDTEAALLADMLAQVVDGVPSAVHGGRLEIVPASREAKLIAAGQCCPSALLAPRTNGYRYLDVYPSHRVDLFLYPHEVDSERATQSRLYGEWTKAETDERRIELLAPLGLRPPVTAKASGPARRPQIVIRKTDGHAVSVSTAADTSAHLDIEQLAASPGTQRHPFAGGAPSAAVGDVVEVVFDRSTVSYYAFQSVDAYFDESGEVHRHPVTQLKRGWRVITFVDGRYDSLFRRLSEAVSLQLPLKERCALELWEGAKARLVSRYQTKAALYERLRLNGLATQYETFTTWFRDGADAVLAPQQFDEFKVVAEETGAFPTSALMQSTFEAVQHARGRNRSAGRALRKFLRAVVSGDGYDETLESARSIDTALADILAAVEVLEVVSTRTIQRSR